MIPIEGKVLVGLDEFMLRFGHLKVLCSIINSEGGSWPRLAKSAKDLLETPVEVDVDGEQCVAEYLYRKKLCPTQDLNSNKMSVENNTRYPNLLARQIDSESYTLDVISNNVEKKIWWQDYCLANSKVRSKVGAVTTGGRSGSKTGFSHICDWAIFLDLIGKSGQLSPMGKLLVSFSGRQPSNLKKWNPYIHGVEILILAYAYFLNDMDLFVCMAPKLLNQKQPLKRALCAQLFVEALEEIAENAEKSDILSSGARYKLFQQIRDLEKSAKRSRKPVGGTSTAWHRAASRVEMYVDMGFLEKGKNGSHEVFEYVYYTTDRLELAVELFEKAKSSLEWVGNFLARMLFKNANAEKKISELDLLNALFRIVKALCLPTRLLPIDVVALGLACSAYSEGGGISIAEARNYIEQLARTKPHIARLSRGTKGDRAEYVSLDLGAIDANWGHNESR